jgi:hypothetical protein
VAIAGLCLVAQAFALVHLFAVRHVRCAEHGEMVHLDGAGPQGASGATSAELQGAVVADRSKSEAATLSASKLEVEAHQDDHCMALSERRDLRTATVKQVMASPQVLGEVRATHREPPLAARPLYRLAPKISPPIAA